MVNSNVCFQINLAPSDLRYVTHTLPHQLRAIGAQVGEIQFTVDTQQSRAFRTATDGYAEKLGLLRNYLQALCKELPHASIVEVDYSQESVAEVAKTFTGGRPVPRKACDGSAFYAYLYGVMRARSDYVLHIDSDMFFGGGSQQWVAEALEILQTNSDVLACYPFLGPPRSDGVPSKRRQTSLWNDVTIKWTCSPSNLQRLAYEYNEISTRVFILDRRRFLSHDLSVPLVRPKWKRLVRSFYIKTSPYLLLEDCLTVMMNRTGLRCIAFFGSENGMWSLHPRYRSELFYAELPKLIRAIETNEIPDGQRGDFDLNAAMIDWSDVYRGMTRLHRLRRELRLATLGLTDRMRGT